MRVFRIKNERTRSINCLKTLTEKADTEGSSFLSPLLHGLDIIHMNILLLFIDGLFTIADYSTLGVGIDPLSIGIVEDV